MQLIARYATILPSSALSGQAPPRRCLPLRSRWPPEHALAEHANSVHGSGLAAGGWCVWRGVVGVVVGAGVVQERQFVEEGGVVVGDGGGLEGLLVMQLDAVHDGHKVRRVSQDY
jgi:hypothetical protein